MSDLTYWVRVFLRALPRAESGLRACFLELARYSLSNLHSHGCGHVVQLLQAFAQEVHT